MNTNENSITTFKDFDLPDTIKLAIEELGYVLPTPVQSQIIPIVLSGRDALGQAQTGTGKTAAFALPLLANLDLDKKDPQVLVLTPTRELAIQVCESFKKYGAHLPGLKTLAIYGGQEYSTQLRALSRGVHVVVGTPGRIMDHLDRQTLNLKKLTALVLDEADEMLKMGFKEDVEFILEHTPDDRQITLFSATLPAPIRAIAKKYLKDPEEVIIKNKTSTVELTRQRYWLVNRLNKLDALSRILEVETYDAVLIFARTKTATFDISDQLEERGFAVAALNGDIQQSQRERTIEQLRSGKLNIIIATDVAARGIDVDRISHVINFDIPYDAEVYIHRIGRTGRAGRSGEAILFVSSREQRMLQTIERVTRQKIEPMDIPTVKEVNSVRITRFKNKISETLEKELWKPFREIISDFTNEKEADPVDVAAALAAMFHGDRPFLLSKTVEKPEKFSEKFDIHDRQRKPGSRKKADSEDFKRSFPSSEGFESESGKRKKPLERTPRGKRDENGQEEGKITYQIEVGRFHGVRPGQIMGAIAGESGIDGKSIGRIILYEDFSTVDLPDNLPETILKKLKRVRVVGRAIMLSPYNPDRLGKKSRADRSERPERSEKPQRAKQTTWSDRPERSARTNQPEREELSGQATRSKHSHRSDHSDSSERPKRSASREKNERA
ncbi:MAG: DEAD/DEAH box helicase [Candidatus Riflebacteria bacterium]|nr:DEAD/DEAH box helicase [Candidatus Riflebacteria bacterium]